jgi:hypothetical protein
MVWVFHKPVYSIVYRKELVVPLLEKYNKGEGKFNTLPFLKLDIDKRTGFFYKIEDQLFCPKQLGDCLVQCLKDLFVFYTKRFVSIEDRSDMLADCDSLCSNLVPTYLLEGMYHPFDMYFKFFATSEENKQYPRNNNDLN